MNTLINKTYTLYICIIIAQLFIPLTAFAEVRDITQNEKINYKNIKILTLPHSAYEDGYGNKPKSEFKIMEMQGLCKDSNKVKELVYNFNEYQWNAATKCYHTGGGYREHLKRKVDKLALDHCKRYERDAIYAGKAKIETQVSSRIAKLTLDWLSIGTAIPYRHVSVSYYCSKDKNPNYVQTSEANKNILNIQTKNSETADLLNSTNIIVIIFSILIALMLFGMFLNKKNSTNTISNNFKNKTVLSDEKRDMNDNLFKSSEGKKVSIDEEKTSVREFSAEEAKLKKLHTDGVLTDEELIRALSKIKKM